METNHPSAHWVHCCYLNAHVGEGEAGCNTALFCSLSNGNSICQNIDLTYSESGWITMSLYRIRGSMNRFESILKLWNLSKSQFLINTKSHLFSAEMKASRVSHSTCMVLCRVLGHVASTWSSQKHCKHFFFFSFKKLNWGLQPVGGNIKSIHIYITSKTAHQIHINRIRGPVKC